MSPADTLPVEDAAAADAAPLDPDHTPDTAPTRRDFLKTVAAAGVGLAAATLLGGTPAPALAAGGNGAPPLSPAPGAMPWHATNGLYSGACNLGTGNGQIVLPVCGWSGKGGGLSFALAFNSQSTRSCALGPKWTYSYRMAIVGTNPAVFIADDGTETTYTLSGGAYTAPAGIYDTLVKNGDGSWSLTRKNGTLYSFRASDGMLASIVDLNGNTISLSYTGSTLNSITDAAGRTLRLGYTGTLLTSITDCQARIWSLSYDASARLSSISAPLLNGVTYSRVIGYDSNSNVHSLQNRLGKTWLYTYGTNNVLTGTVDPDGNTTSNPYTLPQSQQSSQRPGGQPNTPQIVGWPTGTTMIANWTDFDGNVLQHGLDAFGQRLATLDSAGNQSNWGYESLHNRTSYQDALGNTWQSLFDAAGNEKQVQDPYGKLTKRVWTSYGLLSTETDALNNLTQYFYDPNWNLQKVIDANNGSTVYVNNPDGSVQQVTSPTNVVTKYGYDTWGHQSSVTVVKDVNTSFTTSFVFDEGSHITQRTDALGRVTHYTPDAWGRTTLTAYPTTGNPSIQLTLDAESNWTQSLDSTGTRTYGYNSWNRCNAMTDPRGNTSATWSAEGFLKNQTDVTNRLITYALNSLDQITGITDDGGATNAVLTYTPTGQMWTATYQNGTKVTTGYDNAGRVNSIAHTVVSGGATLISYTATYYDNGWLHTVTELPSGDVTTFGYDAVGNLLSEVRTGTKPYSGTYTYYADNQRKTAVVVTNGVTTHNGTYTYDGAGRLSQCIDTATGLTEVYVWNNDGTLYSAPGSGYTKQFLYNEESQLVTIQHNISGTITTAYEYGYAADGGRRWRKDHLQNVWTWYPCGAACSAGALVEETSDLTGVTWTTSALYLRTGGGCGSSLIRRNSEYHHSDIAGNYGIISGATASVLLSTLYDRFNCQRYTMGTAQTTWHSSDAYFDVEGVDVINVSYSIDQRALSLLGEPFQASLPENTFKDCFAYSDNQQCAECCSRIAIKCEMPRKRHETIALIMPEAISKSGQSATPTTIVESSRLISVRRIVRPDAINGRNTNPS